MRLDSRQVLAALGATVALLVMGAIPACSSTPPLVDAGEEPKPATCASNCADDETCVGTTCLRKTCANAICSDLEVCLNDACVNRACVGVVCPGGMSCANGLCYAKDCNGQQCEPGSVCFNNACENARCVGVICPAGQECGNGRCLDKACSGAACPTNQLCEQNACVDEACVGVVCPKGRACQGGFCVTACKSGFFAADAGSCEPQKSPGAACATAFECLSGSCTDGVCCSTACTGPCQACDATGACLLFAAGTDDTPCGSFACSGSGTCLTSCTGDSQCVNGARCVDGGVCADVKSPGETCNDGIECASGNCVDGVCCDTACAGACDSCALAGSAGVCTPVPSGSIGTPACAAYVCNGQTGTCPTSCSATADCASTSYCVNGTCQLKQANGGTCTFAEECASSHCVSGFCCDRTCGGACESCGITGREGTCSPRPVADPGSPACAAPFACNGDAGTCPTSCATSAECISTSYCSGTACTPKEANGQACAGAGECQSGFCVDGVCCDGACSGACDACNQAGLSGTCSPLPAGATAAACGAFVCDGTTTACPTTCADDGDCTTAAHCAGGSCVADLPPAQACMRNAQCLSGFCADGVCCDNACGGDCEACNTPGNVGTCTPAGAGTAGSPTCFPYACGAGGSCATACGGGQPCATGVTCVANQCNAPRPNGATCSLSTDCISGNCVDGRCCNTACAGECDACDLPTLEGTCTNRSDGSPGQPSCGNYLCNGGSATCPTTCTVDADCSSAALACVGAACVPKVANGQSCVAANQCISGNCSNGVCCNIPCSGACDTCSTGTCAPNAAGTQGNPSCTAYLCNGFNVTCPTSCTTDGECALGYFCNGTACVQDLGNGQTCSRARMCNSGNCVNGYCCNSACTGNCNRCDNPGQRGQCTQVPNGTRWGTNAAAVCCGGAAVNIDTNESHCGGCGSACNGGLACESVANTTSCPNNPADVSGRCRCAGLTANCPRGQVCRTFSPYPDRCTPDDVGNCAPGESFINQTGCPNYCRY